MIAWFARKTSPESKQISTEDSVYKIKFQMNEKQ